MIQPNNVALRYGIAVGRDCTDLVGLRHIASMAEWPPWQPPPDLLKRIPAMMPGKPGNPLGARLLALDDGSISNQRHQRAEDHRQCGVSSAASAWPMTTSSTSITASKSRRRLWFISFATNRFLRRRGVASRLTALLERLASRPRNVAPTVLKTDLDGNMSSEGGRRADWEHLFFLTVVLAFLVWYLWTSTVASPTFSNLILIAPVGAVAGVLTLYVAATEIFGRAEVTTAASFGAAAEQHTPSRFRAGSLTTIGLLMAAVRRIRRGHSLCRI